MKRLLLLLSLTSAVSGSNKCQHLTEGTTAAVTCNTACNTDDVDSSYEYLFMCEVASRTSDMTIFLHFHFCFTAAHDTFHGADCLHNVINPFMSELSAGAVTQEEYNAALRAKTNAETAATAAADALQEAQADVQAAQADAGDALQEAQDDAAQAADAADAILASAAEVCPEVQLADGSYSVGPLDCDRIHSVYQNNQCCGTC